MDWRSSRTSDQNRLADMDDADYSDCPVDRVVVHIEQMDSRNKYSKHFNSKLGKLLHRQVVNTETCVTKMSWPHIHWEPGPLFQLGDQIVQDLTLQPACYLPIQSQVDKNLQTATRQDDNKQDVESSDDELPQQSRTCRQVSMIWRRKCQQMYSDTSSNPTKSSWSKCGYGSTAGFNHVGKNR